MKAETHLCCGETPCTNLSGWCHNMAGRCARCRSRNCDCPPEAWLGPAPADPPFSNLAHNHYQLILADPPWAFRTHSGRDRTPTQKKFNEAEDHYPTIPLDDMKQLPVSTIAARDSLLVMWVVGSHCDAALQLGQAWGFRYVTDLFYWCKQKLVQANQVDLFTGDIPPPKMSMGYHTRKQVEPCWLFARGKGLPVLAHDVRQLIIAPPAQHSRKPAEQYDRIDRLYGKDITRAELFSRTPRQGWDAWGNEVGKFEEELA